MFVVAGEESANQYLKEIREAFGERASFAGIAFSQQNSHEEKSLENMEIVFPAEDLAVMGFIEVFFKWRKIKKAFQASLDYIKKNQPDRVLLIDFGGFNLKLAKKIKEVSPQTEIHYFITPKIWAWGEKRALKVKAYIDRVFVIHPFEVDFYKKWGVEAQFVGHPLINSLNPKFFDSDWIELEKTRCGLEKDRPLFGIMLGSRPSEIQKHRDVFCKVAKRLYKEFSKFEVAFIIPPSFSREEFKDFLGELDFPFLLLQDEEPMSRIALCDYCLVASGTATLQVALLNKPMAIAYKMNPITMWLARKFVTGIKHAGLVNILHEREIVPEFLQEEVTEENLFSFFKKLILDQNEKERFITELKTTRALLTEKNTYEVLVNEVLADS